MSGVAPAVGRRAALLGLAGLLVACRGTPGKQGVVARVVSLSPSTTEAAFAVGAGALMVGRSSYCDYPPEALRLPVVGGFADPNLEAILGLRPTLVLGAHGPAGPALEEALRGRGVATYFPETESIAQVEAMLEGLGRLLSHEAGAAAATGAIHDRRRAVEEAVRGRPAVRAVMIFDASPLVVAGPGGFPDELIRTAGGVNLITRGGAYPSIDLEHLLALDPDVLLDGASDPHDPAGTSRLSRLREAPGFRELRALREGRLRPLGATTLRPGPRIGHGLVEVARALHGSALPLAAPAGAP